MTEPDPKRNNYYRVEGPVLDSGFMPCVNVSWDRARAQSAREIVFSMIRELTELEVVRFQGTQEVVCPGGDRGYEVLYSMAEIARLPEEMRPGKNRRKVLTPEELEAAPCVYARYRVVVIGDREYQALLLYGHRQDGQDHKASDNPLEHWNPREPLTWKKE